MVFLTLDVLRHTFRAILSTYIAVLPFFLSFFLSLFLRTSPEELEAKKLS